MTGDVSPPAPWRDAEECPVRGCEVEKYTQLGLELHLLSDHGTPAGQPRDVVEQLRDKDHHE